MEKTKRNRQTRDKRGLRSVKGQTREKEDSEVPKAKQEPGRDTTQENLKKPRTDQRESG